MAPLELIATIFIVNVVGRVIWPGIAKRFGLASDPFEALIQLARTAFSSAFAAVAAGFEIVLGLAIFGVAFAMVYWSNDKFLVFLAGFLSNLGAGFLQSGMRFRRQSALATQPLRSE